MKKQILFITSLLVIPVLIFLSCTEEEITEPTEENLLLSTSFEQNGKFSAEGWTLPIGSDSSLDVPSGGGKYSLILEASNPPELYAEIMVPVKTQFNEFKFTFWSKSTSVTNNIYGKAILTLVRNGSAVKSSDVTIDNIIWKSYSIQDTFTVASGDSFLVQLTGGISQLFSGKSYFDLCKLYGVE